MAKSYTKRGDDGKSSLGSGERMPKDDPMFDAIGTLDELSCMIGVVKASAKQDPEGKLSKIQTDINEANAIISRYWDESKEAQFAKKTEEIEKWTDELDEQLEPLKNFILPGGCETAARLHLCRAVARRAERKVQQIRANKYPNILAYLNRLSSYFFARARMENKLADKGEDYWVS